MAKSVIIRGTTYPDVPYISVPLSTGSGNANFYDTSAADIDATKVIQGYTAYGANGQISGSYTPVNVSQDSTTKVLSIS